MVAAPSPLQSGSRWAHMLQVPPPIMLRDLAFGPKTSWKDFDVEQCQHVFSQQTRYRKETQSDFLGPPTSNPPHAQDLSCALATPGSFNTSPAKITCPRFASGDPTDWILKAEMFLTYKNVNPLDYVFVTSFYLDKPASKWCIEFLREDMCHDWHHFKGAIQKRFGIEVLPSPISLVSHEAKSEEFDPCGTLEEPSGVRAPIIHANEVILLSFVSTLSEDREQEAIKTTTLLEAAIMVNTISPPLDELVCAPIVGVSSSIILESHDTKFAEFDYLPSVVMWLPYEVPFGDVKVKKIDNIACEEINGWNLDLDAMLLKDPPKVNLPIHEAYTRTIWVFDPGGLNNDTVSLDADSQIQNPESSFSPNEQPFAMPIFIFDPRGCIDEEGIEG